LLVREHTLEVRQRHLSGKSRFAHTSDISERQAGSQQAHNSPQLRGQMARPGAW
jgi:hypothetical protein